MTRHELRDLLDGVPDTGDVVIYRAGDDALQCAWRQAEDEAGTAYRHWVTGGGPAAYTAYRAAQDRADAAQDALTLRAPADPPPAARV